MEDIHSGASGLPAMPHVVLGLNDVFVHAAIRRLPMEEYHAEELLKKHRHAEPLKCAHSRLVNVLAILIEHVIIWRR